MKRTVFEVKKMDCPSEENIIRLKLGGLNEIQSLSFDIPNRRLTVIHEGNLDEINSRIASLNFDSSIRISEAFDGPITVDQDASQSSLLWKVLLINISFFVIEVAAGVIAKSMGLVADSLDMLADALVYGLSLMAVGSTIARKKTVAKLSGYFQFLLAIFGVTEVIRRFFGYENMPNFWLMIIVSAFALTANAICLVLLGRSKSEDAHMKASTIFTSNDVIINAGVILAGILVYVFESKYPDLIVGAIVFFVVIRGAVTILKLAK